MAKDISDVEILHREISKTKYKKAIIKSHEEAQRDEYFAFLDNNDQQIDYSVGITPANRISDEY